MKSLSPRYFCFKFFMLFLVIFLMSPKTVFAGFTGKVSVEAVQTLQTALIKAGAIKGPGHADALEKSLRASTAAHRLRLSEVFLHIQKDPDFVKKFPEYAGLVNNPSKTVGKLLNHDAGKADSDGALAMRALSLLQGYDYRNRNADLPEEVDLLVRRVLKDAIDDVNQLEKKYEVRGNVFDERVNSLAEVLDYYDTYKSRQGEIAKGGRKLIGPNEWLDKIYGKRNLSLDEKQKLSLQKRFATYIENKDPLKVKSAFTQADDVLKKVGSDTVGDVAKYFSQGRQKLVILSSASSNARKFLSPVSKVTKRVPVLGVAFVGVDYLIAPEDFSVNRSMEDTVLGLTFTSSTSACATVNCGQFMNECQKKIDPKKSIRWVK